MDALNWAFLGASVICMVLMALAGWRGERLARASYEAGFIAGLRRARAMVRDRAAIAVELAPRGQSPYGMIRAQMAHQIEGDLDEALCERRS